MVCTLRLGLFNARSPAHKTFLLNDFFTSHELNFMFLTETWLHAGDYTPFSELIPPQCDFFSSPRTTGKGCGVASVFKSIFHCKEILFDSCSSFKLQAFETNFPMTVLYYAVLYCSPKFNKDFIQDFSGFVAEIAFKYDHFSIVADFNIHVCCNSRPLDKDFLDLTDSLILLLIGPCVVVWFKYCNL